MEHEHDHAKGFERWMRRRAEKAAASPSTDDRAYRDYLSSVSGEAAQKNAGRVTSGTPGGPDLSEG
ncbi:MAG: hypothetical protein M3R38_16965 [Actinomycetota bacterium]|nr:hypothetical protein [Actinomycetota bacterium]